MITANRHKLVEHFDKAVSAASKAFIYLQTNAKSFEQKQFPEIFCAVLSEIMQQHTIKMLLIAREICSKSLNVCRSTIAKLSICRGFGPIWIITQDYSVTVAAHAPNDFWQTTYQGLSLKDLYVAGYHA